MEQIIVMKMMHTLQLTPTEMAVLQNYEDPITSEFFSSLQKAHLIHQQCKTILSNGHQPTAFEIMEQMAMVQEKALERLYRWTQQQCRNTEAPEGNLLLTQAVARLQDRPILLKYCQISLKVYFNFNHLYDRYIVDEFCTVRRSVVVRSFLDALTKGGPNGTPRPIELHAHDPARKLPGCF